MRTIANLLAAALAVLLGPIGILLGIIIALIANLPDALGGLAALASKVAEIFSSIQSGLNSPIIGGIEAWFPLSYAFVLASLYYSLAGMKSLYRFIKSWIPTIAS